MARAIDGSGWKEPRCWKEPLRCGPNPEETRALHHRLDAIVRATPWLWTALQVVREVLPNGYIAAGAIRDTVWAALVARRGCAPFSDVDVVYHSRVGPSEAHVTACLSEHLLDLSWEVTNQATVHEWLDQRYGVGHAPFDSVEAGLLSWPETATAIGVRLLDSHELEVVAPWGLWDLFELRLRRNTDRSAPPAEVFWDRVRKKAWLERFPELTVDAAQTQLPGSL